MIKNDTTLTFRVYRKDLENNDITLTLETTDHEACLCQAITMLYDKVIGRYNLKTKQYYSNDGKEYCYLEQKQETNDRFTYYYIVTGLRNEWGNFINVTKTLKDNNIKIS